MKNKLLFVKSVYVCCFIMLLAACSESPEDSNNGTYNVSESLTCSDTGNSPLTVSLSWQAPTMYADDATPLNFSDIAQYRVYFGTVTRNYEYSVNINDPTTTSCTIPVDTTGSYFIAMTVVLKDGRESNYSNELIRIL